MEIAIVDQSKVAATLTLNSLAVEGSDVQMLTITLVQAPLHPFPELVLDHVSTENAESANNTE